VHWIILKPYLKLCNHKNKQNEYTICLTGDVTKLHMIYTPCCSDIQQLKILFSEKSQMN